MAAALEIQAIPEGQPTPITRRRFNDLPEHVIGKAFWQTAPAHKRGYYLRVTKDNGEQSAEGVEFLRFKGEDNWYLLEEDFTTGDWFTWPAYRIPRERSLGLGWWKKTDPQHPEHEPSSNSPSSGTSTATQASQERPPPVANPDPTEEFLAGGLHHIATLSGPNPLIAEQPPVILQAIAHATAQGQQIPVDTPPVTAIMSLPDQSQQINRTQHSNGALGGNALPTFEGDRAHAQDWMRRFKVYRLANKTKEQMTNPLQRVGVALSYIIGPKVNAWVESQVAELEEKTSQKGYAETDERLWKEFEENFNKAFTDLANRQ